MIFKSLPLFCLSLLLSACLFEDLDSDSPGPAVSSEEISVSGGQIQSVDDRLTLSFPDGALAAATEITVQQLSDDEITERYPDLADIDFVYELGPDGYTFLEPIEVSYLLPTDSDTDLARALVSFSNGVSENVEGVVFDPATGTITGTLSHFSDVLALPANSSFDFPDTAEHYVDDPPAQLRATAQSLAGTGIAIGTIGGDSTFSPITGSGTNRYITITDYVTDVNEYDTDQSEAFGSATISYTCNEAGVDSILYRFVWTDPGLAEFIDTISGSVLLETEITCIASPLPPEEQEEEPPQTAIGSFVIPTGSAPESVKIAGRPPYADNPTDTLQRYITSGTDAVTVFNSAGEVIRTRDLTSDTYGTLYLQHSTGGDFFFIYGPGGRFVCPMDPESFCEFEFPTNASTTSAEYGRDANGNLVYNQAYRVRGGQIMFTEEQDQLWQENNYFDNEIVINRLTGQTTNATFTPPIFAYESLGPSIGVGVSEDGIGYFVDKATNTWTEFSTSLGEGVRDIECDQFSAGEFGCAIQSFTDATITPCGGSTAEDFACGDFVSVSDGVGLGAAVTDQGNLVVVGADFTDSSIHIVEFTPQFEAGLQIEYHLAQWFSIAGEVGLNFSFVGHAELDAESDAILVSGNGSDNAAILSIDELAELDLLGASEMTVWFN